MQSLIWLAYSMKKETSGKGFKHAHVELVEKSNSACRENGIKRLLQMSALNADADKRQESLFTNQR